MNENEMFTVYCENSNHSCQAHFTEVMQFISIRVDRLSEYHYVVTQGLKPLARAYYLPSDQYILFALGTFE